MGRGQAIVAICEADVWFELHLVDFEKAGVGEVMLEDLAEGLSVIGAPDGAVLTESDAVPPSAAEEFPRGGLTVGVGVFLDEKEATR